MDYRKRGLALLLAGMMATSVIPLGMVSNCKAEALTSSKGSESIGPVTSKDVIYQIITDRFCDGDKTNNVPRGFDASLFDGTGRDLKLYQGGDWQGIINQIPYLKGMGITTIWVSAPYENRDTEIDDYQKNGSKDRWTSFHGYHVRNYFATNKHFGDLNKFKDLRDALHQNGMKLVIDFVTNHTSRYQNPTTNFSPEDGKLYEPDKLPNGEYALDSNGEPYDYNHDGKVENLLADPNYDVNHWFHNFGDRGNDSSRWGYRNKDLGSLADFSQENPEVVKHLEKATNYWAGMGIDGLRHDATLHMNPAFVKGLKDSVDSKNTITHFGEFFIGRPDPKYDEYVYFPKQTGVNNLDFEMYRTLNASFGDFSKPMSDLGNMFQYTQSQYGYSNQTVTFLDNHDVTRFGYVQQNQKPYNAALAVLLTSRGIPNIYYGTEQYVKPNDGSDVAGRVFLEKDKGFNTNTKAYKLIKKLSDLRKSNDAIAYGQTNVLYSSDDVLVYERKYYDDVVVVAVNRQPDKSISVPSIETSLPAGKYKDVLGGELYGDDVFVKNSAGKTKLDGFTLGGGEVNVWSYKTETSSTPKLGDVVSTMGRPGNKVYLYGKGLDGNVEVKFGKVTAKVLKNESGKIETAVPANAPTGKVQITVTKNGKKSNTMDYNVLSGDQNQIIFHVKANTSYGENIYVVGNVPELGNWDVDNCTEALLNPNYPEWYLPVSVPAGKKIEFKFIKKDSTGKITWESGNNHVITSSGDSCGVIDSPLYTWY